MSAQRALIGIRSRSVFSPARPLLEASTPRPPRGPAPRPALAPCAPRLAVTRQEVVHPGRPGESSGCQVITHPDQEAWMNIHKNARLTPYRRQELVARVERGEIGRASCRERV